MFKYEEGVLKVRDFYTSCHNVDECKIPDSSSKVGILISTDYIPEHCKIAVRCKRELDSESDRESNASEYYYILDEGSMSIEDNSIEKSKSYNIDSYVFKQSEDSRILIYD